MKAIALTTVRVTRYREAAVLLAAVMLFAIAGIVPAHAQTFSFDQRLTIGSRGTAVRNLQTFLATDTSIYPEGLVTGYYGSLTAAAVKRFQCRHSIVCAGSVSSTGYGSVGPLTLAKLQVVGGLTGVGGPEIGADVHAPIRGPEAVSTSTPFSATISWNTNEPARHRVYYSTFFPFNYGLAPSAFDATVDANASIILTGLAPNTLYFYAMESTDLSGNIMWSSVNTFRTQ